MRSAVLLPMEWPGIGGAEGTLACICNTLQQFGPVDMMHGKKGLTTQLLEERFGFDLSQTTSTLCWPMNPVWDKVYNPIRRMRVTREHMGQLSRGYDVFVSVGHYFPPFAQARLNILHLLFPFDSPARKAFHPSSTGAWWKKKIRQAYHAVELPKRLATYQLLTVNSEFTRGWAERRYGAKGRWKLWYPPVTQVPAPRGPRPRSVLAVGRIVPQKQPLEMLEWIRQVHAQRPEAALTIAGSSFPGNPHEIILREGAQNAPTEILLDLSLSALHDVFGSSKVFWHTMGWEVSREMPEAFEHFGMSTVEAMSAGCVPVVFGEGGQAQIVQHGINGFQWREPRDLIEYTLRLLKDPTLWGRMSEAAQRRASQYSVEVFQTTLTDAVKAANLEAPRAAIAMA